MSAFRQAARGQGWIDRNEVLRLVARHFGYGRLGRNIRAILKGHMRAAIRRQVFERDGNYVRLLTNSLTDYSRDEVREVVCSVMRKRSTYEREDVVYAVAHYLGFRRVTENARIAVKSAINSGIRQGMLGYEGKEIWREQ